MNSHSGVNESSLVNFTTDLPSLSQLDAKDSLLSFPFDHLYACHSDSSDRSLLQLDKDEDYSGSCVIGGDTSLVESASASPELGQLNDRLTACENQNKRLKDLLIYHLDLIQQQNELITKRDKLFNALREENENLKSKLSRRQAAQNQPTPPPLPSPPSPFTVPSPTPVTSSVVNKDTSPIMLNSFTELLLPENKTNSFLFDTDLSKPPETFGLARTTTTDPGIVRPIPIRPKPKKGIYKDMTSYSSNKMSLLDSKSKFSSLSEPKSESKRSSGKKDSSKSEKRKDALYTVTSNSGNPVIQRVQRNRRRTSTGIGHLNRMPKTPKVEPTPPSSGKPLIDPDYDHFGINKKNKMINTYGKAKTTCTTTSTTTTMPKRPMFGSLSDRLQLIDTTPTGEDPYQLKEADLREQSPIPKLMLQKTNHGRMKVCSDQPTRRIYDPASPEPKKSKIKTNRYMSTTHVPCKKDKTVVIAVPDMELVKTEPGIDWQITYSPKQKTSTETSTSTLGDFSYVDSPSNAASTISLDANEFQELFTSDSALNLEDLNAATSFSATQKLAAEKSKKRAARTSSLMGPIFDLDQPLEPLKPERSRPSTESKRGRKRALSTTGVGKGGKGGAKGRQGPGKPRATKGKGAARGKKTPPPGKTTKTPYHTHVGDPDLSWYLGLDPEVKPDDVDPPTDKKSATVEVPRWREKPFTSCYTMEGTENVDDKVYEKRHQKLEAEERRQLRWHMRRIREQRHVEKLKQRQRDSWCHSTVTVPPVYTVWPRPQRDIRFIEITDTLPVIAFGEVIPELPEADFMLPWVRTSKALKRSKRSKTLH